MPELLTESFATYNFAPSLLLGLMLGYWGLVLFGALDLDSIDLDLDIDADVDLDVDADTDVDLEAKGEFEGPGGGSALGVFGYFLRFLNADGVPLMFVLGFLSIFWWIGSLAGNHLLNPGKGLLLGLGVSAGAFVVSCILTKVVTQPLKAVFRKMNWKGESHDPVVGRSGVVRSAQVDEGYGQVEVRTDGSPLLLNVRVPEGREPLSKGTEVLLVSHDLDSNTYTVREANLTEEENTS